MEHFLGIDVGGTNIKMAFVNGAGEASHHKKVSTASLRKKKKFLKHFIKVVGEQIGLRPEIDKVGIGLPGTLSKDRSTTLEVPAIPQLDGVNLKEALSTAFPGKSFFLENDANAAALGEFYFPKDNIKLPDNFIFITMGTGIGGAAIINGKIFKGGDGNGMEVGHIFSRNKKLLENNIGKQGIIDLTKIFLENTEAINPFKKEKFTSSDIVSAAEKDNELVLEVFDVVGQILGEALVSVVRILDIKTIVIGGGLSASFDYIIPSIDQVLNRHLTPYYTIELYIKRATLANQAGIIGAASLCFQ
jgi:glucokinase